MSCFHPLLAVPRGFTDSGKIKYIPVKSGSADYDFYNDKEMIAKYKLNPELRPLFVPCGRCIGCRLDRSRDWALRCMMELKSQKGLAIFVTLTYNESRVPMRYFADPDTGEAVPVMSLDKRDLQLFWKRLRRALPETKIRYFASGEYGSATWRPHYHAIIFGYRPPDMVVDRQADTGTYFTSDFLSSCWHRGNVLLADVTYDTCAYVARYTSKKSQTLADDFYAAHNIEPPFLVMSRRPGLGWSYFETKSDIWRNDRIYVSGSDPVDGAIPRSFLSKIEEIDPDLSDEIKARRLLKGSVYQVALAKSHAVPYSKLLEDSETVLLQKGRALKRNKV